MKYKEGQFITIVSLDHSFSKDMQRFPQVKLMLGKTYPVIVQKGCYLIDNEGSRPWCISEGDVELSLIAKLEALLWNTKKANS